MPINLEDPYMTGDDIPTTVTVEMLDGALKTVLLDDLGQFFVDNEKLIKSHKGNFRRRRLGGSDDN